MEKFITMIFTLVFIIACSDYAKNNTPEDKAIKIVYEPILVENNSVDNIFNVEPLEFGNAINFISRAGVVNILDGVVDDVDSTGYVTIEKAYKLGSKYFLILSTGENGASCPATSYVLAFDIKLEAVTGQVLLEGCSENVESISEGNKLLIRKNEKTISIVDGNI